MRYNTADPYLPDLLICRKEFAEPVLEIISGLFWMGLKTFSWVFFFILVRAALVRPRYDQLMNYGWLLMLPLALLNLLVTGAIVLYQGG